MGLALGATGCITTAFQGDLVSARAKFDLECPRVAVVHLGNDTFGARGCGKRATYVVQCDGGAGRTDLCNARPDPVQVASE